MTACRRRSSARSTTALGTAAALGTALVGLLHAGTRALDLTSAGAPGDLRRRLVHQRAAVVERLLQLLELPGELGRLLDDLRAPLADLDDLGRRLGDLDRPLTGGQNRLDLDEGDRGRDGAAEGAPGRGDGPEDRRDDRE